MAEDFVGSPGPRTTRLYFIVARRASLAVVFRRGPTRQVELLTWNLATDTLTPGQWLKGRIYERRCDLSPDGQLLACFAAKYETGVRTWTAISRPPYLTALAMWPKGDAWGGGGLFYSNVELRLNHRPDEMKLMEGYEPLRWLRVGPFGDRPGWGEDDPIHTTRLERDGWRYVDRGSKEVFHGFEDPTFVTFDPPLCYRRPVGPDGKLTLEMSVEGALERGGASYILSYRVLHGERVILDLGRADWADADHNGDLLLAREGRLYRLGGGDPDAGPREVADLRGHRFSGLKAPPEAVRRER